MHAKLNSIFCIGANHKSADMSIREQLFVEYDVLQIRIPETLGSFSGLEEICVLSTCNRFEVYGVCKEDANLEDAMAILKSIRKDSQAPKYKDLSNRLYEEHTYFVTGSEAVEHALRVSSSLDSLIVGETQITGQFKDALKLGKELGAVGQILHRLGQEALSNVKKVRTQTEIGAKTVSISHAAIDLAKRVFDDLSKHTILVVGAGEMARLAAQYAVTYNPKKLFIANRTLANAQTLCERLGGGTAHTLDELDGLLLEADIVISSTAANGFVLSHERLKRIQKKRRRTAFFVDIALPRDIEPKVGELDDLYLFEVDDLKQVVDENLKERQKAAELAEGIVNQSCKSFEMWLSTLKIKPVLARYRSYLQSLVDQEMEKSLRKLGTVSDQEAVVLDRLKQSIVSKITADMASELQGKNLHRDRFDDEPSESEMIKERSILIDFFERLTSGLR